MRFRLYGGRLALIVAFSSAAILSAQAKTDATI